MNVSTGRSTEFTIIELIAAVTILTVLALMAIPLATLSIKREKERELRRDLWDMRDAIDRYKDAADRRAFQTKVDSQNYPPDLETLVKGVDVGGKKLKFLRRIPVDPMTKNTDWGCDRCKTIRIPTPGAGRTCSTCTPSRKAKGWTERNTMTGRRFVARK
jgi:general secretion pathway protein G